MLLAIFSVGLFFAHVVNASDYGLCINRSRGDMKKAKLTAIMMKSEAKCGR